MRKFVFLITFFICILSGLNSRVAPNNLCKITTTYPAPLILFKKNSHFLLNDSKKHLDKLYEFMTSKAFDSTEDVFYNYYICLRPSCCENEYLSNKYLGVQRAIEIIDYLEGKYGIKRTSMIIVEKYKFNDNSLCTEKNTGVEFFPERIIRR